MQIRDFVSLDKRRYVSYNVNSGEQHPIKEIEMNKQAVLTKGEFHA
jgi:hypothetical protein